MKKNIYLSIIFFLKITCIDAQNKKYSIAIDLLPLAYITTSGSGLNVNYNYKPSKGKMSYEFGIGFMYNNYNSGLEREFYTQNGVPLANWSTEVDIMTSRPYPLGGVVNENDFYNIDKLGIVQYKPKLAYRLNRFVTLATYYNIVARKKINCDFGIGLTSGLSNRDETHVGFTGNISNEFNGLQERFWVNINIRSKYLYIGALSNFRIEYTIRDNFRLGFIAGLHYIVDKEFREDAKIPYLGLSNKIMF
jgi:hypothetical protein